MKSLFDEVDDNNKELAISKSKQVLSKKQKDFFKHTATIESLKEKIKATESHFNSLEQIVAEQIDPELKTMAAMELDLAKVIGSTIRMHNYTHVQKEKTIAVVLEMCQQSFNFIEPNEQDIAFYNKLSPEGYEKYKQKQLDDNKDMLSEMLHEELGIDIDMDDLNDDPESFMRFQQMLEEKMHEQEAKKYNRKKTKKQLEAEEKRKLAEELKNKNLRSIYVSLAKILHPDLEENEDAKAEKEELMKTVTTAYEAKDLPTLLKLEMQWVYKQAENIDQLSDEKLDVFNNLLKDQIKELKDDLEFLNLNPRYQRASMFAGMTTSVALGEIQFEKERILHRQNQLLMMTEEFLKPHAKKKVVHYVNEYFEEVLQEEDLDDDDMDFLNNSEFMKEVEKMFKKATKNR